MMKKYIAERYQEDFSTPMGNSDFLLDRYDDVIDFSLGDPDITTDGEVIRKTMQDALDGHTHYTSFQGDIELRQALVENLADNYGVKYSTDEIMVTTSGCHAMWLALESITNDGEEIILHEPYFTPYPQQVLLTRGIPTTVPTYEEDLFQIDPKRLEAKITDKTKAIIINTPNNPTGACFSRENLEAISKICQDRDIVVISDDIYTLYSYKSSFVPIVSIPGMKERTIVIGSFSKDYAMTGWRIGFIAAPKSLIDIVRNINENNVFTAPSISQRAALHALKDKERIQAPMLAEYRSRLNILYEEVCQTPKMSMLEPMGTIYAFVNIKQTGMTAEEVAEYLLENAHIVVLPGTAFGEESGEGYIRFAITVDDSVIRQAFARIRQTELFNG
ncbi:aminotransferase class I/II-fold pyridoxal phosphate-dependent enzyme [Facklamia sp. DSM 111018]|uniref:Aminotransferase n=2 Tax=Facklamia lactis TaxID=2749967 RepID=A0ABS0LT86_9LACT|nr:aminotransferase class I/II-fold pyridoxal phosphate-dependent enzyme [Facklamia lactis]MBG9987167.1 aminotransferase class I/II-fold pyridoxal phosphate-dependent enzyme [Facklamia lactis]